MTGHGQAASVRRKNALSAGPHARYCAGDVAGARCVAGRLTGLQSPVRCGTMGAGGMAQMRRMLLLAVTAALLVAGSAGSAAGAREKPTITVREGCQYLFDGLYGGWIDVVGLKPNTEYVFSYGPGLGAYYFTTNDAGAYPAVGGGEHTEPFELNVQVLLDPNHNFRDGDESIVLEAHFAFTRPCYTIPGAPDHEVAVQEGRLAELR